jgi:hypothetical protein
MKKIVLTACILLTALLQTSVYAIERNIAPLNFGVFAGGNSTDISELPEMIVPPNVYSGYTLEPKTCYGFTGGIFLNYRPGYFVSFQPELSFATGYGKLVYSDLNDFKYDLDFKYNFLNVGIGFKFHLPVTPHYPLFLSVTPQVGFNLTPDELFYKSNGGAQHGSDLETQRIMRTVIKGRTNVSLGLGLGYQFWNRIYVDVRYNLGLSDMIETLSNGFGFSETKNKTSGFQFTVGYTILPIK